VNVNEPAVTGVPESRPVEASRVRPGGRLPLATPMEGAGVPEAMKV
jgi:hypothetical protein